jgi:hypothetical protein
MAVMSAYNQQQKDAFLMVRQHLERLPDSLLRRLKRHTGPYLQFRSAIARFQEDHFSDLCSQKCFTSRTSACCGREGILTFFADVVINSLLSSSREIDDLLRTLEQDEGGFNCVYLTDSGCLWRLKPIVCEMFLCEDDKKSVLDGNDEFRVYWEELRQQEKEYTWPNRPVLFDELEVLFIEAGFESPLMYFHRSPGLLRVKAKYSVQQAEIQNTTQIQKRCER